MLQLQIEACHHEEAEEISELLEELGALSVTMTDKQDDPIFEPELGTTPLWPQVVIQALFAEASEANNAIKLTTSHYPHLLQEVSTLEDQDWELVSKADFKPLQFGERLWICPSWISPPAPDAVNLILDPGLAFGTGTHPTTSLCLTWLDQADIVDKIVVDYGCGSGILALAALKLGSQHVYAVDIDAQALLATQNNAHVNHIPATLLTVSFSDELHANADLILANILLSPLLSLQKRFKKLLKPQAKLIVSGILEAQIVEVITAYKGDFKHESTFTQDGWGLVVLESKPTKTTKA